MFRTIVMQSVHMAEMNSSDLKQPDDQFVSMLCTESEAPCRAFRDRKFLRDDRILQNLLAAEDQYLPNSTYFDIQPEIKPPMRTMLANWMHDVCEEQKCEEEVFYLSMNYVDRFLSVAAVPKRQFQLLGSACLLIASKLREALPFTSDKLMAYTDFSITMEQLLDCELTVCQVLKWQISIVTPYDFVEQIFLRLSSLDDGIVETLRRHTRTFVSICSTEITFSSYPASMIAAASIMAAAQVTLRRAWCDSFRLVAKIQSIISADADCLRECQEQIERLIEKSSPFKKSLDRSSDGFYPQTCQSSDMKAATITPTDVMDVKIHC